MNRPLSSLLTYISYGLARFYFDSLTHKLNNLGKAIGLAKDGAVSLPEGAVRLAMMLWIAGTSRGGW